MIQKRVQHGCTHIEALLCRREADKVLGCSSSTAYDEQCPEHLRKCHLEGLGMRGFISALGSGPTYIGFQPDYRDLYSISLYESERMTRTLKRVQSQIDKDEAHTATEVFESLARALKLSFVAERTDQPPPYGWNEAEWHFYTVPQGRNRFRHMIEREEEAARGTAA